MCFVCVPVFMLFACVCVCLFANIALFEIMYPMLFACVVVFVCLFAGVCLFHVV